MVPASKQKITFSNQRGELLTAILDHAAETPKAWVLYSHCFTCSKDIPIAARISRALVARGFSVMRFDFTGLGGSEGNFADTNFTTSVADLLSASGYLEDNYAAPKILIGHSMGGTAALAAAGELPDVNAVATIGSPAEPGHVLHHFSDRLEEIKAKGAAEVMIQGRPFIIRQQMIEDLQSTQIEDKIKSLRKPLMIFHAPFDHVVNIRQSAHIYRAAHHPKSFISLDGADHMLSKKKDSDFVSAVLASWVCRYV